MAILLPLSRCGADGRLLGEFLAVGRLLVTLSQRRRAEGLVRGAAPLLDYALLIFKGRRAAAEGFDSGAGSKRCCTPTM